MRCLLLSNLGPFSLHHIQENKLLQNLFGSIKTKRNREKVTQLAMMEDRFSVWDEIHRYFILGNVLLAHTRQHAAGLHTNLNSQTPVHSGKMSV